MQKDIAISLFDYSGVMLEPWKAAGFECWLIDIQHPVSYSSNGFINLDGFNLVNADLSQRWYPPFDRRRIAFVSAFPPCDHLAVSGARWFKGKGLRALSSSINMFATAAEFCEWSQAPYMIENPVSTISSYWRKSDFSFHPYQFTGYCAGDNYTKKTNLWVGNGFVLPEFSVDFSLGDPDDRIHKAAPGENRKNFRSQTPAGFAEAVFRANFKGILEIH